MLKHEANHGAIKRLYGFAWVVVRNVAISRLPWALSLEQPIAGSAEAEAAIARLTTEDGSPGRIESSITEGEVHRRERLGGLLNYYYRKVA
jgi:hypothetical protein